MATMSGETTIKQLSQGIVELEKLRGQAKVANVQKELDELIKKWKGQEEEKQKQNASISLPNTNANSAGTAGVRPMKKLTTYAFDESDKFVKLYYTVPGITGASADSISTEFDENSFSVQCTNVKGIDFEIKVRGLCQAIDASKSLTKQKSGDQLLVMLKKSRENQHWGSLLKLDQDKEKSKMPKMGESADPQEGLMNMMKQMYDDGDDEMKRTLRKAWHEAQSKKGGAGGELGGMMEGL